VSINNDNVSWVEIPLLNVSKLTDVGIATMDAFDLNVYTRFYFPPQNQTASASIIQSFDLIIEVDPLYTPQTWVIIVLLCIAIFSFTLQILDFLFKKET
jgi:hypothetical protein